MKTELPKRSDFRFAHGLRVRWAEVDLQKIVFNAHYLMYCDVAVTEYWRALGAGYNAAMQASGGDLYVKKATLTYHASARFDDVLDVGMRCAKLGNSSMVFEAAIFRQNHCLVSGELTYVFADPISQRAQPLPPILRQWLTDYEAGAPMVTASVELWQACEAEVMSLRTDVFHAEVGIDLALMSDPRDAGAVHVLLRNRLQQAVACGRAFADASDPQCWHIGRMATVRELRGARLGQQVMAELTRAAGAAGAKRIELDAIAAARAFYERLGYAATGPEFEMAGFAHIPMRLALPGC